MIKWEVSSSYLKQLGRQARLIACLFMSSLLQVVPNNYMSCVILMSKARQVALLWTLRGKVSFRPYRHLAVSPDISLFCKCIVGLNCALLVVSNNLSVKLDLLKRGKTMWQTPRPHFQCYFSSINHSIHSIH